MNGRDILTVLLVVALIAPAAGATTVQPQSPASQPADTAPATEEQSVNEGSADEESGAGSDEESADEESESGSDANYTRLYVEDSYQNLELKPGENDSFDVAVENGEDDPVTVDPHLYLPRVGDRPVEEDWVTIEGGEATLDAGEERTFTVTVSVPGDADLAHYRGVVAFTDETITYPGRPAQRVHATSFAVRVYEDPTVNIVDGEYMHTQIRAGENYTHSIVIENTGDQAVPVNPQVRSERERRTAAGGDREQFQRSWVDIDAPSEIEAGETATVNVTISPPAEAEVGDYDVTLDLGLKDPARDDRRDYWQRVRLGFQVWEQPEEPFTTDFAVSEEATEVTLTLTSRDSRHANAGPASFNVSFVTPNGTVIEAERVQTTNTGHVDLTDSERSADDSSYGSVGGEKTFTYRVENPESGEWTARIMPENTIQFSYELVREEG